MFFVLISLYPILIIVGPLTSLFNTIFMGLIYLTFFFKEDHYKILKSNKYENAMVLILYNLFNNLKNIRAFNNKPNIFYIKNVNSWEIMNVIGV